MKIVRKALNIISVLIIILTLAGCGGGSRTAFLPAPTSYKAVGSEESVQQISTAVIPEPNRQADVVSTSEPAHQPITKDEANKEEEGKTASSPAAENTKNAGINPFIIYFQD